jgi:hypothetical protein
MPASTGERPVLPYPKEHFAMLTAIDGHTLSLEKQFRQPPRALSQQLRRTFDVLFVI